MEWALSESNFKRVARVLRSVNLYSGAHFMLETGDWATDALSRGSTEILIASHATPMAGFRGDFVEQIRIGEATIAAATSPDDPDLYLAWGGLAGGYGQVGPSDKARHAITQAHRFAKAWYPALDAYWSAVAAAVATNHEAADQLISDAKRLARQLDHPLVLAFALTVEANLRAVGGVVG